MFGEGHGCNSAGHGHCGRLSFQLEGNKMKQIAGVGPSPGQREKRAATPSAEEKGSLPCGLVVQPKRGPGQAEGAPAEREGRSRN